MATTSDLQLVNDRLEALISSLSAPTRKEMMRSMGRKLRASQQQNIKRQQAPDGTPFKPPPNAAGAQQKEQDKARDVRKTAHR